MRTDCLSNYATDKVTAISFNVAVADRPAATFGGDVNVRLEFSRHEPITFRLTKSFARELKKMLEEPETCSAVMAHRIFGVHS